MKSKIRRKCHIWDLFSFAFSGRPTNIPLFEDRCEEFAEQGYNLHVRAFTSEGSNGSRSVGLETKFSKGFDFQVYRHDCLAVYQPANSDEQPRAEVLASGFASELEESIALLFKECLHQNRKKATILVSGKPYHTPLQAKPF